MSIKIIEQEFHFAENRNNCDVRTVVPKELIDDAGQILVQPIRKIGGISAGDDIWVKIMSADGTEQLHRRLFTVKSSAAVRKAGMDARGLDIVVSTIEYILAPVRVDGEWQSFESAETESEPEPARVPERYVSGEGEQRWNPDFQYHEIVVGGQVVAHVPKGQKDRALAIAAGSEPLPEAA